MNLMIHEKEIVKEHNPETDWLQRTCKVKQEVQRSSYNRHHVALLHFEK